MAIDTSSPRSRRALLAGILGALAALAAQALGRPLPALAEGETVVVGGEYTNALSETSIRNSMNDIGVFKAESLGAGVAIAGFSSEGSGIQGSSEAATGIGVIGIAYPGTGVYGLSHTGTGVYGKTISGDAIEAYVAGSGHALRTHGGRVRFQQVSGVATIPAGATGKTVKPGVNVVAGSFVLLTPRANLGGRSLWYTTNPTANSLTIHLSSPRPSASKVAWLLLG